MNISDVRINGTSYIDGAYAIVCCNPNQVFESSIDFDLSRSFALFSARLGVRDDSTGSESPARIRVLADDREIYSRSFGLGQSEDVRLSVEGILRLRVIVLGSSYKLNAAIGDPTVTS